MTQKTSFFTFLYLPFLRGKPHFHRRRREESRSHLFPTFNSFPLMHPTSHETNVSLVHPRAPCDQIFIDGSRATTNSPEIVPPRKCGPGMTNSAFFAIPVIHVFFRRISLGETRFLDLIENKLSISPLRRRGIWSLWLRARCPAAEKRWFLIIRERVPK